MGNLIGGGGSYGNSGGYGGGNQGGGYGGGYGPYRGGRYWGGKMTPQSRPGGGAMGAGLGGGNQGGLYGSSGDVWNGPGGSGIPSREYGDSSGQVDYSKVLPGWRSAYARRNYSDPLGNPVGGYNIYDGKGGQKFWPDWTPMPGGWSTTAPSQGPGMTVDKTPTQLKPNPDAKYEV